MAENNGVSETTSVVTTTSNGGNNVTKTEVRSTRVLSQTASTHRLTKANSVQVPSTPASPFAKFKQMERQNSAPNARAESPMFKISDPKLARSASSIKDRMLSWVKAQTAEYKNVQIDNFSTSWNDGMAFCALIHHFYPHAFDFEKLSPQHRRHNFELAFRVAEEEADLMPLLDVEDMVVMKRPDWKCVFTYVQTFYRRFHSDPRAEKVY
ncbi:hypothetical protein WDU94_006257 [Cyamophila willieti]